VLVADGGLDQIRASPCVDLSCGLSVAGFTIQRGEGGGWRLLRVACSPSTSQCEDLGPTSQCRSIGKGSSVSRLSCRGQY
jgi:hypothetical protein